MMIKDEEEKILQAKTTDIQREKSHWKVKKINKISTALYSWPNARVMMNTTLCFNSVKTVAAVCY